LIDAPQALFVMAWALTKRSKRGIDRLVCPSTQRLANAVMELYSVSTSLSMASSVREAVEVAVPTAVVEGVAKFITNLAPASRLSNYLRTASAAVDSGWESRRARR
jgi:hypothetical protein